MVHIASTCIPSCFVTIFALLLISVQKITVELIIDIIKLSYFFSLTILKNSRSFTFKGANKMIYKVITFLVYL